MRVPLLRTLFLRTPPPPTRVQLYSRLTALLRLTFTVASDVISSDMDCGQHRFRMKMGGSAEACAHACVGAREEGAELGGMQRVTAEL